ncbi:MAG: hypothetical protein ABII12_14340 [Planctomycetota bacterium]
MILQSPLSIPPNPLAGPRRVGDDENYIELDPANGRINTAGDAAPLTVNNLLLDIWRPPEAGEYTTGLFNALRGTYFGPTADTLYAVPCILPRQSAYSAIGIRVDSGTAGKHARLGIYADDDGNPGALIIDAGAFEADPTGFFELAFGSNVILGPGLIWLALLTDGIAESAPLYDQTAVFSSWSICLVQSGSDYISVYMVTASWSYSALPSVFGAPNRTLANVAPFRIVLKGA